MQKKGCIRNVYSFLIATTTATTAAAVAAATAKKQLTREEMTSEPQPFVLKCPKVLGPYHG